jgi:hypothetical protein
MKQIRTMQEIWHSHLTHCDTLETAVDFLVRGISDGVITAEDDVMRMVAFAVRVFEIADIPTSAGRDRFNSNPQVKVPIWIVERIDAALAVAPRPLRTLAECTTLEEAADDCVAFIAKYGRSMEPDRLEACVHHWIKAALQQFYPSTPEPEQFKEHSELSIDEQEHCFAMPVAAIPHIKRIMAAAYDVTHKEALQ